jgi:hypothetical protein
LIFEPDFDVILEFGLDLTQPYKMSLLGEDFPNL